MALLLFSSLAGCGERVPTDKQAYIGTYIYEQDDTLSGNSRPTWDRLILEADDQYRWEQSHPTGDMPKIGGKWRLVTGSQALEIRLNDAGYPIQMRGGKIRLIINYDTDEYWGKAN